MGNEPTVSEPWCAPLTGDRHASASETLTLFPTRPTESDRAPDKKRQQVDSNFV
jgi:hypothetical protein